MQRGSRKQPAKVNNLRTTTDTIEGTAGPKELGVDRTGIVDHLGLTFLVHLWGLLKGVVPAPRYGLYTRDQQRSHNRDFPCPYKMRPEELVKAYICPYK